MIFQPYGKSARKQSREKHNGKGDRVSLVVGVERKFRVGKQEIKYENAYYGGYEAVNAVGGNDRCYEHAQDIHGNNVCLVKAQMLKQHTDTACQNKHGDAFQYIGYRHYDADFSGSLPAAVAQSAALGIGYYMYVKAGGGGNEPFRECGLAEHIFARGGASADDYFRYTRKPCKFRYLIGHIGSVYSFYFGAQLSREADIGFQPFPVLLRHYGKIRCFHKQRRKGAAESACHSGGGSYYF